MKQITGLVRAVVTAGALMVALYTSALAQGSAAGGRIPTAAPKPKAESSPEKTTPKNPSAAKNAASRSDSLDRIDGKWWTTGNGFGDSEVVLTQNGAAISGEIRFADGRTGSINGRLVGKRLHHTWTTSSGAGGSGWLELSWANFLGGAWHNQQVKDGSWTLNRIEGQWCFGGNRSRIRRVTHDERGRLTILTEDGSREEGHMEGPWLFLDSDGQSIKGSMFYKGNRVDWASGTFWTWCGR